MPKYVTLEWYEYTKLRDDLKISERKATEGDRLRDQLISIVVTTEDEKKYYEFMGPLPPVDWRPITNEQIVERVKEKFGV